MMKRGALVLGAALLLLLAPAWAVSNPRRATQARGNVPELVHAIQQTVPKEGGGETDAFKVMVEAAEDGIEDLAQYIFDNCGGAFSAVDYHYAHMEPTFSPSQYLADGYKAILTFTDYPYTDNVEFGDSLAKYMDMGGGVVITVFSDYDNTGWNIDGRFRTQYMPVPFTNNMYSPGDLGTVYEPTHPVMQGISSLGCGQYMTGATSIDHPAYTTRLADWTTGQVEAAAFDSSSRRVVFLGFFAYGNWIGGLSGQWCEQIVNALNWVAIRPHNARPDAILVPHGTADSGATVTPRVVVRNAGANPELPFRVRLSIAPAYRESLMSRALAPDQAETLSFPSWTANERGWLNVKCTTELAGDMDPGDDQKSESLFVRIRDCMTVGFVYPVGSSVDSGLPVVPVVSVKNNGTQPEGFNVRLTVVPDGYVGTESVYVQPTQSALVSFEPWNPTRRGYNILKCSTRLDGDRIQNNDAVSRTIRVNVYDAGVVAIVAPSGGSVPPGPIFPRGTVHNYGNVAGQMPAQFDIYKITPGGDSLAYSSSNSAWVSAGANGSITFDNWTATGGSWRAGLTTILDGDPNSANDTMTAPFYVLEAGHDVGAIAVLAPLGIVDTLPKTPQVRVKNFGSYTETFWVYYWITDVDSTGADVYRDSALCAGVGPGLTMDRGLPDWTGHHWQGHYTTKCWTAMPGDGNLGNDTARNSFQVLSTISDVGVVSIDVPVASVDSGVTVTPAVTVHNYGNSAASFYVTVGINISPAYTSTVSVTGLSPNIDTILNTFTAWPAIQRGNWTVQCTTNLVGDLYNANDTATKAVAVNVHDLGAVAIVVPVGGIPPITFTPKARVHNHGNLREPCTVTFMINSTPPYNHTQSLTGLPPGVDSVVGFSDTVLSPGSYTARCSTYLATDQVPGNEVVSAGFQVGTMDVSVQTILAPLNSVDSSAVITPSALVRNLGTTTASFPVRFTISTASDAVVYTGDTTVYSLAGGGSVTATFPDWAKPHALGNYNTKCSTMLAGDATPGNDAAAGSFSIAAGGGGAGGWTALAPIPVTLKNKRVKDGGALAYAPAGGPTDQYVYAFKGNNTYEFYRYSVATNAWVSRDSIPAYNRNLKKKGVKKGSSLTAAGDRKLYATKGNNTYDFWQYDPAKPDGMHWTEMLNEVPMGTKACKEGVSMASATIDGTNYIYFLKGSGTYEFYRYNADTGIWDTSLPSAPNGYSAKPFKNGSSIAYDGGDTIYCLKGSYNDFFAYSISNRNWVTLDSMPKRAPPGTKKVKVKDGSGTAVAGRIVYALKGSNSNEFWTYLCDSHRWYHGIAQDMPSGLKKVKAGGALVASPTTHKLYAFRGNNTLEFWQYWPGSFMPLAENPAPKDVQGNSSFVIRHSSLSIAPNPFAGAAQVSYSVPKAGNVSLRLYDVTGKLVSTLASGYRPAGNYAYRLSPTAYRLSAGVYLLKYETAGEHTTQKLIIE